MPSSKKSRLQRQQRSESIQARAATIIPYHRDSIVRPGHTEMAPTISSRRNDVDGVQTIPDSNSPSSNQSQDASRRPSIKLPPQTDEWMTVFCQEPPGGDAGTCCLAFWMPPAQYGKTNWRLNQKASGKDPDDWHSINGCSGPCWAYVAFQIAGFACKSLSSLTTLPCVA